LKEIKTAPTINSRIIHVPSNLAVIKLILFTSLCMLMPMLVTALHNSPDWLGRSCYRQPLDLHIIAAIYPLKLHACTVTLELGLRDPRDS
jgi:hypothetical protein